MPDDSRLLSGARRMERRALAEIYDTYSPGLYRYAMRLLGDVHLAEECVAETFSRFLNALDRGGGPTQYLQAYLYRVAHNWITDRYRSNTPDPVPLENTRFVDPQAGPAQQAIAEMERQEVRAAISLLTPDQRQVIILKFLEGWQNQEIAQTLGKSVGAIKALQNRALSSLKRELLREEESQ